jgi:D-glycero-beta-D-manno-heptose-7-phosphate kinase
MDPMTVLAGFTGRRVAVIGDAMLDEFVLGDVTRISPEAPVPILEVRGRESMAGGAANAAANVASLGGVASIVGVVGEDEAAESLRALITQRNIDASKMVGAADRPTTRKTRIVARNQQVVRIDHEVRAPLSDETKKALMAAAKEAVANADACIVSDYAKGVVFADLVRTIVDAARAKKVPIVVDPKQKSFAMYRGVTVITPNLVELEMATGRACHSTEEVIDAAGALMKDLDGTAILVTRGAAGMSLFQQGKAPVHVPARARAVFDVTGAGDTVVSTLALCIAGGASLETAIEIASLAAGLVVSKPGTATVTQAELRAELEDAEGGAR